MVRPRLVPSADSRWEPVLIRPATTPAVVLVSVFGAVLVAAVIAAFVVKHPGTARSASEVEPPAALGHVHGLGVDPGSGALYIASHFGVYRVDGDGQVARVANRWQDTMGFAVVGRAHFLASGHPDLTEDRPVHLGLIESRDSGETWEPLSLEGEGDLHAIAPTERGAYAYESRAGELLATDDRRTWRVLDRRPLVDLAVAADDPSVVYATTATGRLLRYDTAASTRTLVEGAPALAQIDWSERAGLVGASENGTLHASPDGRAGWGKIGAVHGSVEALDTSATRWHVATKHGVFESADEGRTWSVVIDDAV